MHKLSTLPCVSSQVTLLFHSLHWTLCLLKSNSGITIQSNTAESVYNAQAPTKLCTASQGDEGLVKVRSSSTQQQQGRLPSSDTRQQHDGDAAAWEFGPMPGSAHCLQQSLPADHMGMLQGSPPRSAYLQ